VGQLWLEGPVGVATALGAATCALDGASRPDKSNVEDGHGGADDEREVVRCIFVGTQGSGRGRFLETGW